jgi:DnaK suppressor protein
LNKKDLERFRALLIEERRRVLDELGWLESNYIGKSRRDVTGGPTSYSSHPADAGTDSMEMEKAYLIGAAGGEVLEDIDEALRNIDKGRYGICQQCGDEISEERLDAVPYARLCVKCKSDMEKPGGTSR